MATHFVSGSIDIRLDERAVFVDGVSAGLGSRAIDLLEAMIARRDRVMTKDELLEAAWPGLVVEENNLQVQISNLRKVLGKSSIATIPGRGYRFTLAFDGLNAAHMQSTAAQPTSGLPLRRSTIIGREEDVEALRGAVANHALVTVVGAGGMGKTALALEVAHAFELDGARVGWAELASITDSTLVPGALARALDIPAGRVEDPFPSLIAGLGTTSALVVLDNAEHLGESVARLAAFVLDCAPRIRLLVTSQAPLAVDGEHVYRLDPLDVPPSGGSSALALGFGAVRLFVDQAQAIDRKFELTDATVGAVVELCRRLDGNALAIKLASSQLPFLGLSGVNARLHDSPLLLRTKDRDVPERQRTLVAALEWSHGLLGDDERKVFRRLGVCAGGFTLETGCAIASDTDADAHSVVECIGTLVDRSLVNVDRADPPRYSLADTPRWFALMQLKEAGEEADTCSKHADAMHRLFEEADNLLWRLLDEHWIRRFEPEVDNLRQAMDWCARHNAAAAVAIWAASASLFNVLPLRHESLRRSVALETLLTPDLPVEVQARYFLNRSQLHWGGDNRSMERFARRAAALYRERSEPRALYVALASMVGSCMLPPDEAKTLLDEMSSLEDTSWPAQLRAMGRWAAFHQFNLEGRSEESRVAAEAGLRLARLSGSAREISVLLNCLITAQLNLRALDEAILFGRELIALEGERKYGTVVHSLANLARGLWAQGHSQEARRLLKKFFEICKSGDWDTFGIFADWYSLVALREARLEAAARLIGFADKAWERIGQRVQGSKQARAAAYQALLSAMDPDALRRLIAEGHCLSEDEVCALTLGEL